MKIGRNYSMWSGLIWSLLVTQVVTYIHNMPTPLLLLFTPYKFLVCMMIKFRIMKKKGEKKGEKKEEKKGEDVSVFFLQ